MDAESLSDDIYAKASELRDEVQSAMDRLESVAALPYLSWFNLSQGPAFEPQRAKSLSGRDDLPTLEKIAIPAGADLTLDMMEPYKSKVWKSPELAQLETMMLNYIETGGTGINQAVEDAIYNRSRERDLQAMRDAMDLAGARTGARGFRYPTSMTKALQSEALTKYQEQKGDLNREIVRLIAELAQKNTQFAAGSAIDIEKAYMDFSRSFAGVVLDIKRSIMDKFRIEQETRIAEFEGQLKGILANLDVELKNAGLEQGYQEQLMKKWEIESSNLLEKGRAQIAQAENANSVKLSAALNLTNAYIGLMQNMQANSISLVTKKS